jgi:hypothetical protein
VATFSGLEISSVCGFPTKVGCAAEQRRTCWYEERSRIFWQRDICISRGEAYLDFCLGRRVCGSHCVCGSVLFLLDVQVPRFWHLEIFGLGLGRDDVGSCGCRYHVHMRSSLGLVYPSGIGICILLLRTRSRRRAILLPTYPPNSTNSLPPMLTFRKKCSNQIHYLFRFHLVPQPPLLPQIPDISQATLEHLD